MSDPVEDSPPKGLVNHKGQNNCFINVLLQTFYHLPGLRMLVLGSFFVREKQPLLSAFWTVFWQYRSRHDHNLPDPAPVRRALSDIDADFGMGDMVDVAEALNLVLDTMQKELSAVPGETAAQYLRMPHDGSNRQSAICENIIQKIFALRVRTERQCLCGYHDSSAFEEFVHYGNTPNLIACIESDTSSSFEEIMYWTSEEQPSSCPRPECLFKVQTKHVVERMPEILVCGLSWNSSHSNPAVIETIARSIDLVIDPYVMVEGPEEDSEIAALARNLHVKTEYLESAVAAWGSSAGASTTMDPDHRLQPQRKHAVDQSKAFILTSVVCFTMGHYVVFTYFPKNESWMAFDDTTVTEVGEWEACVQSMISKRLQPSLLFYCRSSEGNDIRLQNHKLVEVQPASLVTASAGMFSRNTTELQNPPLFDANKAETEYPVNHMDAAEIIRLLLPGRSLGSGRT